MEIPQNLGKSTSIIDSIASFPKLCLERTSPKTLFRLRLQEDPVCLERRNGVRAMSSQTEFGNEVANEFAIEVMAG